MFLNNLAFFGVGLVGLWIGAELIVRGAMKISKRLGLSETFIGLTMLAIGTDFPEIMVALTGAIDQLNGKETADLIVGNILGSTMSQIALVLGIAGTMKVLKLNKKEILQNGLMVILATCLFFILSLDGMISRGDGLIFVVVYIFYFLTLNKTSKIAQLKNKFRKKKGNPIFPLAQLAIGLIVISEASHLVLDNGINIASDLGISQMLVGIILIGVGTSLPELVVSIKAVMSGSNGLSVGNLIGSNIIDILIALGGSALIGGWRIDRSVAMFDIPFLLLTTVIVVLFLLTKQTLERKESFLLLGMYGVYLMLKLTGW